MFSHHEPCPNCGSRDNLGRYSDGGAYCFGCHYREKATHYTVRKEKEYEVAPEISPDFSPECVAWLAKYGVSLEELVSRDVGFSTARNQLVFRFDGGVWQARNFDSRTASSFAGGRRRSKYFTQGAVNDCLPIYDVRNTSPAPEVLVLVEDCISAIKVARQYDSMPLLGSNISYGKLADISRLYPTVVFWLDADKLKESRALADRAKLLGINSRVVYTKLDPKEYSDVAIQAQVEPKDA